MLRKEIQLLFIQYCCEKDTITENTDFLTEIMLKIAIQLLCYQYSFLQDTIIENSGF